MSEKRFTVRRDEKGAILIPNSILKDGEIIDEEEIVDLLNEQQDKIIELEKNFDDIVNWASEIAKRNVLLDEKIGRLQQEEKLYAQEILRLNTLLKQYQANQDLGGGY